MDIVDNELEGFEKSDRRRGVKHGIRSKSKVSAGALNQHPTTFSGEGYRSTPDTFCFVGREVREGSAKFGDETFVVNSRRGVVSPVHYSMNRNRRWELVDNFDSYYETDSKGRHKSDDEAETPNGHLTLRLSYDSDPDTRPDYDTSDSVDHGSARIHQYHVTSDRSKAKPLAHQIRNWRRAPSSAREIRDDLESGFVSADDIELQLKDLDALASTPVMVVVNHSLSTNKKHLAHHSRVAKDVLETRRYRSQRKDHRSKKNQPWNDAAAQ